MYIWRHLQGLWDTLAQFGTFGINLGTLKRICRHLGNGEGIYGHPWVLSVTALDVGTGTWYILWTNKVSFGTFSMLEDN